MQDLENEFRELIKPIEDKYFNKVSGKGNISPREMLGRLTKVQEMMPEIDKEMAAVGMPLLDKYGDTEENVELIKSIGLAMLQRVTKSHVNGPDSVDRSE